ncbi:DNA-binding response regulator [Secundilactobacillus paracollinoides]|uniref:DNA-binding response regulator n=1 Tax=Secundilactobacillus paracollinoides TaxID=240427 RepID=A0A1B2IYT6_9LACO|nr:response regulator transcription factor [Secundilactobacillus paracollinoides]ANZ64320.1 DNA-binding response regulator [Secundilactobacillus paracollinoides]ANZ67211.1 DNA-binding response regulator [Secundilactobacillus paracollinoides]KRL75334.1 response regulator [Secundilactobacillus paracollinoides DSM 15502 = JCM 11969]
MPTATILIVEDHDDIRTLLKDVLAPMYTIAEAADGVKALSQFNATHPDLIILDLMLPGIMGESVLKTLRKITQVPVLVLTAIQDKQKIVDLLEEGANDYLTKPFDIDELVARVKVQLRQVPAQQSSSTTLTCGLVSVNQDTHEILVAGKRLTLPKKEFELLTILMRHPHQVYQKEQLYETVWGEPYVNGDNTMNVHLSNLRTKINNLSPDAQYVNSIWGIGVRFD